MKSRKSEYMQYMSHKSDCFISIIQYNKEHVVIKKEDTGKIQESEANPFLWLSKLWGSFQSVCFFADSAGSCLLTIL